MNNIGGEGYKELQVIRAMYSEYDMDKNTFMLDMKKQTRRWKTSKFWNLDSDNTKFCTHFCFRAVAAVTQLVVKHERHLMKVFLILWPVF